MITIASHLNFGVEVQTKMMLSNFAQIDSHAESATSVLMAIRIGITAKNFARTKADPGLAVKV